MAKDESFLHALDKILQSPFHLRVHKSLRLAVKSKTMVLLASMVEGRRDRTVHRRMAAIFDAKVFELVHAFFSRALRLAQKDSGPEGAGCGSDDSKERVDEIMHGAVSLQRVLSELSTVADYNSFGKDAMEQCRKSAKVAALDHVAVIEVLWKGRVEAVGFPLPPERHFLSSRTKAKFTRSVDLSTNEKRVKELLVAAPNFISEMTNVHGLALKSRLYSVIYKNLPLIKWCMYALVVLLNVNVAMATFGAAKLEKHPEKGYTSALAGYRGGVADGYWLSLCITWGLGLVNALGYVTIVSFLSITEVPIVIQKIDSFVEEALNDPSFREENYLDASVWAGWFAALTAVAM